MQFLVNLLLVSAAPGRVEIPITVLPKVFDLRNHLLSPPKNYQTNDNSLLFYRRRCDTPQSRFYPCLRHNLQSSLFPVPFLDCYDPQSRYFPCYQINKSKALPAIYPPPIFYLPPILKNADGTGTKVKKMENVKPPMKDGLIIPIKAVDKLFSKEPFKSKKALFDRMQFELNNNLELQNECSIINATFKIILIDSNSDSTVWFLKLSNKLHLIENIDSGIKPDAIIEMNDEDFLKLIDRSLNVKWGYITGKIKFTGDFRAGLQLDSMLEKLAFL